MYSDFAREIRLQFPETVSGTASGTTSGTVSERASKEDVPLQLPLTKQEFDELQNLGYQFYDNKPIGKGLYSDVYKCKFVLNDQTSGQLISIDLACKRIDMLKAAENAQIDIHQLTNDILNEISVHQSCRHPNVTDMHFAQFFYDSQSNSRLSTTFIFSELCSGHLKTFILKFGKDNRLSIDQAGRWFVQIAIGLQYLHFGTKYIHQQKDGGVLIIPTNHLVKHGDMHGGNFLFKSYQNNVFVFKIADFGMSKFFGPDHDKFLWEMDVEWDITSLCEWLFRSVVDEKTFNNYNVKLQMTLETNQKDVNDIATSIGLRESFIRFMIRCYDKRKISTPNDLLADQWMQPFVALYTAQGIQIEP